MYSAHQIVNTLLEADEPLEASLGDDESPAEVFANATQQIEQDRLTGQLTPVSAQTAQNFYHRTKTYSNGRTPISVRRNGATKTWKTRPGEFRIPVKYGMYEHFYITQDDVDEWSVTPLPEKPRPEKVKARPPQASLPGNMIP